MDEARWSVGRDAALRIAGVALCALACGLIACLHARARVPQAAGPADYALAATAFTSACCGSAMTCLGRHLFDRVAVNSGNGGAA